MTDYYSECHQAQQEQAVPNLCPECNGSAYSMFGCNLVGCDSPPEYDIEDCEICHGTGTIDRPYTERDLWIDDIMYDTRRMIKQAERVLDDA